MRMCVNDPFRDATRLKFKESLSSSVYGLFQTTSELKEEEDARTILSEVRDGKSNNDPVRFRGQEGGGLSGEPEEVPSDQAERVEAMLSYPIGEEMVN